MAFDGVICKKISIELKKIIGFKIDKISEPDKNTIVFGLYGNTTHYNLLACISSNNCRINLTKYQQKNPIVAPNFCMLLRKHLTGFKIKNIYTNDLERIVFINLENAENPNKVIYKNLIIELMGKHSNIILTNEQNIIIDSMRHTSVEDNSNRDIYPTSRYIYPESSKNSFLNVNSFDDFYTIIEPKLSDLIFNQISNIDNLDISNFEIDKIISENFNGISSSLLKNIMKELKIDTISKEALEILYNKLKEVISSDSIEFVLTDNQKDYYIYTNSSDNVDNFELNYSLDKFYYEKETFELFKNYRNSILTLILATLKKYEKRLSNIDTKLQECAGMDKYRLYGELITANLYRLPKTNTDSITVENYYDNNTPITIPLNKQFNPSVNAKRFFKKYSKLKNALEIVSIQKEETIADINYIESVIYELEACQNITDVQDVYDEISENSIFADKLKVKKQTKKPKKSKPLTKNKLTSFNPLKYTFEGYTILVGRNNKENDYLTCKYARKTDLWFHTKDAHGSHVILKVEPNETVDENVLYEAAKLAVQHSKAKNSSKVPVDYCLVSSVKKPGGSKPGYVIYKNNKTIYV